LSLSFHPWNQNTVWSRLWELSLQTSQWSAHLVSCIWSPSWKGRTWNASSLAVQSTEYW